MKHIETKKVSVRDLLKGYTASEKKSDPSSSSTLLAYDGKLNLRPEYARNYFAKPKFKYGIVDSVYSGFPIGLITVFLSDKTKYELADGQQRIVSILEFCCNKFAVKDVLDDGPVWFSELSNRDKDQILDYEMPISIHEGTSFDKRRTFIVQNIHGSMSIAARRALDAINQQEQQSKKSSSQVNIIYTDPPFNSEGKDFSDYWDADRIKDLPKAGA